MRQAHSTRPEWPFVHFHRLDLDSWTKKRRKQGVCRYAMKSSGLRRGIAIDSALLSTCQTQALRARITQQWLSFSADPLLLHITVCPSCEMVSISHQLSQRASDHCPSKTASKLPPPTRVGKAIRQKFDGLGPHTPAS
jgi:hypothetical protein